MQLLVVGMHRSGTSAVANILVEMGAYFGDPEIAIAPNDENPKGFWERTDFRRQTDRALHAVGAEWHRVTNWDLKSLQAHEIAAELQKAFEIELLAELERHRPWVLKDPRLCLLLPLWRPSFEAPVAVLIYRHPFEVALSLQTRNGFPLAFGVALWEYYLVHSLASTADMPRVVIAHGGLLSNPVETASKLYSDLRNLGVQGLHHLDQSVVGRCVEPSLYRAKAERGRDDAALAEGPAKLWQALKSRSVFLDEASPPVVSQETLTTLRENERRIDDAQT